MTRAEISAAIDKQRKMLNRQEDAVQATKGMIAMLEHQLEQINLPLDSSRPKK